MFAEFLFVIAVLAVLIVGLLVMVRAINFEQIANGVWRGFLVFCVVLAALFTLKAMLLPILTMGLVWLKQMMLGLLLIVLAMIASLFALRALGSMVASQLAAREADRTKGNAK